MIDENYKMMPGRLSDKDITYLCMGDKPMISPFLTKQVGKPSAGLSSAGYDFKLSEEYMVQSNYGKCEEGCVIDPLAPSTNKWESRIAKGGEIVIGPGECILASTMEHVDIPHDIQATVLGKSTMARNNVLLNTTPLEPCYDDQTEILTKEGWKFFKDVSSNEVVATLTDDGFLEYEKVTATQKYAYDGELLCFNCKSVDLAVTPEHRVYVRKGLGKEFELLPAIDIYKKWNYEFKRDAIWNGEDREFFKLPESIDNRYLGTNKSRASIVSVLGDLGEIGTERLYEIVSPNTNKRSMSRLLSMMFDEDILSRRSIHSAGGRSTGANHSYMWSLSAEYDGNDGSVIIGEKQIKVEDWLRFFAAWISDGSATKTKKGYSVRLACFKNRKVKTYLEWLGKIPFNSLRTSTGFNICSKQLYEYLVKFGHAPYKYIPDEIKSLSPRLLRIFIEALMHGDGNIETQTYSTSSKRLADDIQEIAIKAGMSSCMWFSEPKIRIINGVEAIGRHRSYKIRVGESRLTPSIKQHAFSKKQYVGYVYDVTVPNHIIHVRRNGKTVWSGNCWNGNVTLEIKNCDTTNSVKLYVGQGIAQCLFDRMANPPARGYSDRESGGVYQGQQGVTTSK